MIGQKGTPNTNRDSEQNLLLPDPTKSYGNIIANMSVGEFFNKLNELLKKNPPYDYDKQVLEQFAQLGIGAGLLFDTTKLSAAVKDSIAVFMKTIRLKAPSFMLKEDKLQKLQRLQAGSQPTIMSDTCNCLGVLEAICLKMPCIFG
jgi:hypothetical protein